MSFAVSCMESNEDLELLVGTNTDKLQVSQDAASSAPLPNPGNLGSLLGHSLHRRPAWAVGVAESSPPSPPKLTTYIT